MDEMARDMMLDLAQRVLHLNGAEEEMSGEVSSEPVINHLDSI